MNEQTERERKLRAILDAADRRIDEGAGMTHDEFWRQVESADRTPEDGKSKKRRRRRRNT